MSSIKSYLFLILALLLLQCTPNVSSINYGKNQCHSCKMTIVDKVHSAQYVTSKGKNYMFDAVECLVQDINRNDDTQMHIILVADYGHPGNMTDATKATYLVSPKIKSPMGAFLSAFSDKSLALQTQTKQGGKIYNWEQLKIHIKETF